MTTTASITPIIIGRNETTITWLDARHELPDDEESVLVATEEGEVIPGFHEAGQWRHMTADLIPSPVSHWSYFPDPPPLPDPNQGEFWKS